MITSAPPLPASPGALDRALASIDWPLRSSRLDTLAAGGALSRGRPGAGLAFVTTGSVTLLAGQDRIRLGAGDLVIAPRAHRIELRSDDGATVLNAEFAPSQQRSRALAALPDTLLVREFSAHEPSLVPLILGMDGGYDAADPDLRDGDTVVCGLMLSMIASSGLRLWAERGCAPERWPHRVADPYIARAIEAVHASPGTPWTVPLLAQTAAMSRSTFAARFHALVGQTPASFVAETRIETAKRLLGEDGLSVVETAHRLGYASEAGFSRAFRRRTGVSPSRWRGGQARAGDSAA